MANDEEKTTVEAGEDKAASGEAAKGDKKKLIVLAGVGLAAVVVGLAVALFVVKPMLSGPAGEQSGDAHMEQASKTEGESSGHTSSSAKKPKKGHGGEGEALVYAIKDIVVNPAGTGGSRFLSVSFGFELNSAGQEAEFAAKEPAVRDALITILSSKTVAQLTDAKQKEIVRYQIRKRVSQLVGADELIGVYFTDFVLQ